MKFLRQHIVVLRAISLLDTILHQVWLSVIRSNDKAFSNLVKFKVGQLTHSGMTFEPYLQAFTRGELIMIPRKDKLGSLFSAPLRHFNRGRKFQSTLSNLSLVSGGFDSADDSPEEFPVHVIKLSIPRRVGKFIIFLSL